jgi:hypothetical protein
MSFAPDIHDPTYSDLGAWMRYHTELLAKTKGKAQFGRWTGLPKHLPTVNEFGLIAYLVKLRLPYRKHVRIHEIAPSALIGHNAEFDIFVSRLGLAIDINPAWHLGGKSEIPRVAEIDRFKQIIARDAGIHLIQLDPTESAAGFARAVNSKLVPYLRSQGVRAFEWPEQLSVREQRLVKRLKR